MQSERWITDRMRANSRFETEVEAQNPLSPLLECAVTVVS